jgi:hypothetical protein
MSCLSKRDAACGDNPRQPQVQHTNSVLPLRELRVSARTKERLFASLRAGPHCNEEVLVGEKAARVDRSRKAEL